MDFSFYPDDLNFSSVEQLPGLDARAAFTVNSQSVFREDTDIVPTLIDDKLSYITWGRRGKLRQSVVSHLLHHSRRKEAARRSATAKIRQDISSNSPKIYNIAIWDQS